MNGRYYAMDRDRRWERIAKAFNAMVFGDGEGGKYVDPVQGVKDSYNKGVTDEFIVPFVCVDNRGEPLTTIRDEDSCICFNFRADRVRQITRALARNSGLNPQGGSDLPGAADLDAAIPRDRVPKNLQYVCMTQYDKKFTLPVVIPPESLDNILANVMGQASLRNLRVAETEKYAHVTYFFNGGVEQPFPGEDRLVVPSQKVATYDLKPEMSAAGIADAVIKAVEDGTFDVIIVNFANADMVGHSGKDRADGEGGRNRGRLPGPDRAGGARQGRSAADHGRSWQCGNDDRSRHRRPAHRPHHEPRAIYRGGGEWKEIFPEARRLAARYLADRAGHAGYSAAEGNDRTAICARSSKTLKPMWRRA